MLCLELILKMTPGRDLSYEKEVDLYVNELVKLNSFSYEKLYARPCVEMQGKRLLSNGL